jgi:hypothetical protein
MHASRRPHDWQRTRLRFGSRTFFASPAFVISHAAPDATISISTCGSINTCVLRGSASVRVRSKVQLTTSAIGYVGVNLCGGKIGMTEHFLNGAEVRTALEQMRREGMPQEVGVDALWVEPCLLRELAQDEERPGPCERAAPGVQEELGPVARVQVRPPSRDVAPERLGGMAADRDDPFFAALADHPNQPVVEVDTCFLEPHRLGDAQPGAVEELHERLVAQRPRLRPGGRVDQPLGLAGRKRARQPPLPARQ